MVATSVDSNHCRGALCYLRTVGKRRSHRTCCTLPLDLEVLATALGGKVVPGKGLEGVKDTYSPGLGLGFSVPDASPLEAPAPPAETLVPPSPPNPVASSSRSVRR